MIKGRLEAGDIRGFSPREPIKSQSTLNCFPAVSFAPRRASVVSRERITGIELDILAPKMRTATRRSLGIAGLGEIRLSR